MTHHHTLLLIANLGNESAFAIKRLRTKNGLSSFAISANRSTRTRTRRIAVAAVTTVTTIERFS